MRGAAMKVGQMLSMVDFDGLPEDQRDDLQRRLATLRDGVPPVPFATLEKLMRQDLGAPLGDVFADFEPHAFAAASIGQVHRATTLDGRDVAVKVQYPGVAEAVETDLRNATLLLPLVKRLAPGLDGKALAAEMRERISEELDYELEAQNQRRIERLLRGHPSIRVPRVSPTCRPGACSCRSTSRASASRRSGEPTRPCATATARSSSASSSACCIASASRSATRTRATTCCAPTAGLLPGLRPGARRRRAPLEAERAIARAVRAGDAQALKAALTAVGYLPADRADAVDADWALTLMRMATSWYAEPGARRFRSDDARRDRRREPLDDEQRDAMRDQMNQFTLPPESLLIRRMHGIVAVVLGSCAPAATGARSPRSTCTASRPRRRSASRSTRSSTASDRSRRRG